MPNSKHTKVRHLLSALLSHHRPVDRVRCRNQILTLVDVLEAQALRVPELEAEIARLRSPATNVDFLDFLKPD